MVLENSALYVQNWPWAMKRNRKSDLKASCLSLVYLCSSLLRKQIYIISSVIKLPTSPSHSPLSAGDLTYYFTKKTEAFRREWPHLLLPNRPTFAYACTSTSLLLQWWALCSYKTSGPIPFQQLSSLSCIILFYLSWLDYTHRLQA